VDQSIYVVGIVVIVICSGIGHVTIHLTDGAMVRMVGNWLVGVLIQRDEEYGNCIIGDSPPEWPYLCKTVPHIGKDLLLMGLLVAVVEMSVLSQWHMIGLSGSLVSVLW
jgi:hypothetical protein